ncbi:MAG: hypothetical protein F4Y63_07130 [Chloroflexi bacterium]|nr:hypothetical protein [Chloroflexota bacterium]
MLLALVASAVALGGCGTDDQAISGSQTLASCRRTSYRCLSIVASTPEEIVHTSQTLEIATRNRVVWEKKAGYGKAASAKA